MEIPLNAKVACNDGICGRSVFILINPVLDEITHLVVRETSSVSDRIIPVDVIEDTTADTIHLRCSKAEFNNMEPFITTEYVEEKVPDRFYNYGSGSYGAGSYYYLPYVTPDITVHVPIEQRQIPPEEMAIRRGENVEAADGLVGHVDEFVVEPKNCHITHLVMREGHLWGQKDVIIPISEVGDIRDNTVFLKLNKQQVEDLPTFPIHRHWT